MSQESQRVFLGDRLSKVDYGIPVKLPNTDFDIPKNATYGEVWIIGGTEPFIAGGAGAGRGIERTVQGLQLSIFIPEGKGTKPATLAADKFAAKFAWQMGRDAAGCTYHFKGCQIFTPSVKNGYTCIIVRIMFWRDEFVKVGVTASV